MKVKKAELVLIILVASAFAIGIYVYPDMPAKAASHWNAAGQVDGYMPKFWGTFLMPLMLAALSLLFIAILRIDPLKANIAEFRKYYDGFIVLFFLFMLSIYGQTLLWNLGTKISPNAVYPIGFGILLYYIGILLDNAKRNWFIGIRTPWTLSSDRVWEQTHQIGGKLFRVTAVISIGGFFWQAYAAWFVLLPVILSAIYTTAYSYFAYQREDH